MRILLSLRGKNKPPASVDFHGTLFSPVFGLHWKQNKLFQKLKTLANYITIHWKGWNRLRLFLQLIWIERRSCLISSKKKMAPNYRQIWYQFNFFKSITFYIGKGSTDCWFWSVDSWYCPYEVWNLSNPLRKCCLKVQNKIQIRLIFGIFGVKIIWEIEDLWLSLTIHFLSFHWIKIQRKELSLSSKLASDLKNTIDVGDNRLIPTSKHCHQHPRTNIGGHQHRRDLIGNI